MIYNAKNAKKAARIFSYNEPIFNQNKEKTNSKDSMSNQNHFLKVIPNESIINTQFKFFIYNEKDNLNEIKAP